MDIDELEGILTFIKHAENLKNTFRFSHTSIGRQESTAEHSWRLCLLVVAYAHYCPHLDLEKTLKLAVIHDLPEAVCGDTPAIDQVEPFVKTSMERAGLEKLLAPLPENLRCEFSALWEEYTSAKTQEAKFVKAMDKIETLIQHNQGSNSNAFNYSFNLTYGKESTDGIALTASLRTLIDAETKSHID